MKNRYLTVLAVLFALLQAPTADAGLRDWGSQLVAKFFALSWQKKAVVVACAGLVAGILIKKILSSEKLYPEAVATERVEQILSNAEKVEEKVNQCEKIGPDLLKEYLIAMAKKELKTDSFNYDAFKAVIERYLGIPLERTKHQNNSPTHITLFGLMKIPAARHYWALLQKQNGGSDLEINYDDGYSNRLIGYQVTADSFITDTEKLKNRIANIYKIHLMPPTENVDYEALNDERINKDWIDTDINAAADILVTVLKLIKENEDFRDCLYEFKFVSALSIPRKTKKPYPFIVLYPKPEKKYAQKIADILHKELKVKKTNPNHVYLTPRANRPFCKESPIYYLLGDGQFREQNPAWAEKVYNGPFFKESFIGVSKEDQMLDEPRE